jgi:hypothetical protein
LLSLDEVGESYPSGRRLDLLLPWWAFW